jgi:hypothetical protein
LDELMNDGSVLDPPPATPASPASPARPHAPAALLDASVLNEGKNSP